MADVQFELDFTFDASPRQVWDELIDWKGHERWVPSTNVVIHTNGDPAAPGAEFTAWTGPLPSTSLGRKVSFEDRMRVDVCDFESAANSGTCRVSKLGPLLSGYAGFTVEPVSGTSQTAVHWFEDVQVTYAPQLFAPAMAQIGATGFRFAMSRLRKRLSATSVAV